MTQEVEGGGGRMDNERTQGRVKVFSESNTVWNAISKSSTEVITYTQNEK